MTENLIAKSSLSIHAPITQVWDALINPELIKQYLFGSEVVSDWKEGSPVVYKGNYQGKTFEDKGNVVKIDPEKQLILTHWSPLSGTSDSPENYRKVTYTLTPENESTKITITQDNNASEDEQKQSEAFWLSILENMKKLLEPQQ